MGSSLWWIAHCRIIWVVCLDGILADCLIDVIVLVVWGKEGSVLDAVDLRSDIEEVLIRGERKFSLRTGTLGGSLVRDLRVSAVRGMEVLGECSVRKVSKRMCRGTTGAVFSRPGLSVICRRALRFGRKGEMFTVRCLPNRCSREKS